MTEVILKTFLYTLKNGISFNIMLPLFAIIMSAVQILGRVCKWMQ